MLSSFIIASDETFRQHRLQSLQPAKSSTSIVVDAAGKGEARLALILPTMLELILAGMVAMEMHKSSGNTRTIYNEVVP